MHQESARKQIEYYCSEMEALENSLPQVAAIIEKCALESVPSLCQVWPRIKNVKVCSNADLHRIAKRFLPSVPPTQSKTEGQIIERIKVNWKFARLISTIIEKSWPTETCHHDTGMILQHLLSWSAAKNIFQLYGKNNRATGFYMSL